MKSEEYDISSEHIALLFVMHSFYLLYVLFEKLIAIKTRGKRFENDS